MCWCGTVGGFLWLGCRNREKVRHVKSFHQTCQTSKSDHKRPKYTLKRQKRGKKRQNGHKMTRRKIRNFGPIVKQPMSLGPSGPELSSDTSCTQILTYMGEKMRKNWKLGKMAKIGPNFGQNACYEILNKIRNYGPIFKRLMSKGPSGLGLSKKTLIPKILQYSAEKMRKNLQKRPKMTKLEKNGLNVSGRSSAVYDHVYWLEVDSEPAGRGLNAKRFSSTCDVVTFYDFFQKTEIFQNFFFLFLNFLANRWSDFQNFFFGWSVLPMWFFEALVPPNPNHRLRMPPV